MVSRAFEERSRGMEVAVVEAPRDPPRRDGSKRVRERRERRVGGVELDAVPVSLFEVVAEDLVPLDELVMLEPVGERSWSAARVALGSDSYAASRIRRWRKRKRFVLRETSWRSGRISSFRTSVERCDLDRRLRPSRARARDRAAVEDLALDRASLDDDALVAVQRVDSGLEQRVDRRRHDDLVPSRRARAPSRASPRRRAGSPRTWRRCARASWRRASRPREGSRSARAVVFCERLQQERRRVQLPASPTGPCVEELRARDAEEEDRRVAREIGDVLDEIREDVGSAHWRSSITTTCGRSVGPLLEQSAEGELRLGRLTSR